MADKVIPIELDEDFRQRATLGFDRRGFIEPPVESHVVLLIHGIRTRAEWQTSVKTALEDEGLTAAIPLGYDYLDLLNFWCPLTRRYPIRRLHKKIAEAMRHYPDARLSAIAHSFGTYSLATLLSDFANIRLQRLILCGSVLPLDFQWWHLGLPHKVLNECGRKDVWPVMATRATWGYGPAGTFGFRSALMN